MSVSSSFLHFYLFRINFFWSIFDVLVNVNGRSLIFQTDLSCLPHQQHSSPGHGREANQQKWINFGVKAIKFHCVIVPFGEFPHFVVQEKS
jgi:hypothetical protein